MTTNSYAGTPAQGRVAQLGQIAAVKPGRIQLACAPSTGATAQVSTCTVSASPSNSTTYSFRIAWANLSRLIAFTTDGSATQSELSAGLLAALKADPYVAGIGTYTEASNVITMTFKVGITATLTEVADSDSKIALATPTAAASAPSYPFSRFVTVGVPVSGSDNPSAALPTAPTPSSFNLDLVWASSTTFEAAFNVIDPDGNVVALSVSFAGGANATAAGAAAVTALEAALTGLDATAGTAVSTAITVAVTLPTGYNFGFTTRLSTDTAATIVVDDIVRYTAPGTMGLVLNPGDQNQEGVDADTSLVGGGIVPVLTYGAEVVVLDPGASVTYGTPVYVEFTAGATRGRPYTTYANGRFKHPTAKWVVGGLSNPLTGESLAIVEL
jgi:hypothetical protein